MTNNYRICHVLTTSETNTRFICHVLTPSELFAVICYVCLSVYNRFRQRRLLGLLIELFNEQTEHLNCGFASVSAEQIE